MNVVVVVVPKIRRTLSSTFARVISNFIIDDNCMNTPGWKDHKTGRFSDGLILWICCTLYVDEVAIVGEEGRSLRHYRTVADETSRWELWVPSLFFVPFNLCFLLGCYLSIVDVVRLIGRFCDGCWSWFPQSPVPPTPTNHHRHPYIMRFYECGSQWYNYKVQPIAESC